MSAGNVDDHYREYKSGYFQDKVGSRVSRATCLLAWLAGWLATGYAQRQHNTSVKTSCTFGCLVAPSLVVFLPKTKQQRQQHIPSETPTESHVENLQFQYLSWPFGLYGRPLVWLVGWLACVFGLTMTSPILQPPYRPASQAASCCWLARVPRRPIFISLGQRMEGSHEHANISLALSKCSKL